MMKRTVKRPWRRALLYMLLSCLALTRGTLAQPLPPELMPSDFLAQGEAPFVCAEAEAGRWCYADDALYVSITRHAGMEDGRALVWFETQIKCRGEERLTSLLTTHGKVRGHSFCAPTEIAQGYGAVLAFTDDFFGSRWYNHKTQGIVIRNGEILSDKTFKNGANAFPPLEVLALFRDGSMRVFGSKEHTAKEYLDMGVTDTYAFGPILLREGALGERMEDEDYSPYREPRCALGMVEPHHYIVLTVEGRSDTSRGVRLRWLAEKMLELGAVEALNLDGGKTTCLLFMGEVINGSPKAQNERLRRVGSLIGIGVGKSAAVE